MRLLFSNFKSLSKTQTFWDKKKTTLENKLLACKMKKKKKEKKRKEKFYSISLIHWFIHSFFFFFFFCNKIYTHYNITFRTWLSDPRGLLWCDIWLNFRMLSILYSRIQSTGQFSFHKREQKSFATIGCLGLRWLTIDCFCYKATTRLSLQIFWLYTILDSFS